MARPYHGYGPDGYKPSPYHGTVTNLDWAKRARETRALRSESPRARLDRQDAEHFARQRRER